MYFVTLVNHELSAARGTRSASFPSLLSESGLFTSIMGPPSSTGMFSRHERGVRPRGGSIGRDIQPYTRLPRQYYPTRAARDDVSTTMLLEGAGCRKWALAKCNINCGVASVLFKNWPA